MTDKLIELDETEKFNKRMGAQPDDEQYENTHVCKYKIIRGSGKQTGTPMWKCICGERKEAS